MSTNIFHGLTTQGVMNSAVQSPFKFGRMFNLNPLYLNPIDLIELGKAGGIMDAGTGTTQLTNDIPLGMIFFGQFIDHDITLDATSSFSTINDPGQTTNFRTPNLDLDCIFGDGPEVSPFLYEQNTLRLITGATNQNPGQNPAFAAHDLARTGQGTAIIGDPRNDENRTISQLQLAFIRFYNSVYNDVELELQALNPSNKEIYEEARRLVTWHYQWIVLHEFLPLLCGPETVNTVLGMGRKFYLPKNEPFIPVEFSVAAYRFGHSMIAQNFSLQQGGPSFNLFDPFVGIGFTPISDPQQIVEWQVLFDFDGSFQRAEKLDIKLASHLLSLPFVQGNANEKSLAIRNLMRSQSFLLPSGEIVAETIGRPAQEIQDVRQYLETLATADNIDVGPGIPLWLYILAEADVIGKDANHAFSGEGLGPVGGLIVAEVLIGLMELDPGAFLGSNRNWTPTLGGSSKDFTMTNLLEKAVLEAGAGGSDDTALVWTIVPINTSKDLYAAHFPGNNQIGYTCGLSGTILKTFDGGNSWYLSNSGVAQSNTFYAIYFIDINRGFVVGNNGSAFKTLDGGSNWIALNLPGNPSHLRSVAFADASLGYIIGDGKAYQTLNGGSSWTEITATLTSQAGIATTDLQSSEIYFITDQIGFILLQSRLLRTDDAGATWAVINVPGAAALYDLDFIDDLTGFVCGIGTGLYKTTDSGLTWAKLDVLGSNTLTTVKFYNATSGYVAGSDGKIYQSTDAGATWTLEPTPNNEDYHDLIYLPTLSRALGFGKGGTIVKKFSE